MTFNAIEQHIVVVVTNYLFNSNIEFENDDNSKIYMQKYGLKKIPPKINVPIGTIPSNIIQQMQGVIPVVNYEDENKNFRLTYNDIDKNISFEVININEDNIKLLKDAIKDFIDLKMSDIKAMGLNFISLFNLKDKKLKILNDNIDQYLPNFKKNIAFQLTLLLQLDDCVATYKIRKKSGGDDTNEDRIYQIDANLHFNVSLNRTQDKINKINDITNHIDTKYLPIFNQECNNILAMNDGKKEE